MPTPTRRCLVAIATLLGIVLATLGAPPAAADPALSPGDVGTSTYGCPGFPGNPAGGVCLYEPTHLAPRYGRFHSVKRSDAKTFTIPYLVGFIDVNSYQCAVHFYDVTYPNGKWTLTYLFSVWDNTNHNGTGGYIVEGSLQTRVDYGEFYC